MESGSYKKHIKTHEVKPDGDSNQETADSTNKADEEHTQAVEEQDSQQEGAGQAPGAEPAPPAQRRYKCGLCVKTYLYLHSLKKHMATHIQVCSFQ